MKFNFIMKGVFISDCENWKVSEVEVWWAAKKRYVRVWELQHIPTGCTRNFKSPGVAMEKARRIQRERNDG